MFWFDTLFGPGPLPRNMNARKLAKRETDDEFMTTFSVLLNLVTSMFKWEGLPESVNPRTLELSLLCRGFAAVAPFHGEPTNMGAYPSGGYNVHGDFVQFYAYGWNGYSAEYRNYLKGSEIIPELENGPDGMKPARAMEMGVLIRDNNTCVPMVQPLLTYCKRLATTMRRIDTVSYNLVWPGLIEVDDGQVGTVRQLIQDHDDNLPVVIGRAALADIGGSRIDLGATPETLNTMWSHYDRLFSRLMEMFGIESNATIGKAERVNTLETAANSVRTELARDNRLHCREEAAERMNELFGWNASVTYDETITERSYATAAQIYESAKRTPGSGEYEVEGKD